MRFVLGYLGRIFSAVIAFSPAGVRRALGDFVGFLWFDVLQIRRDVAVENVRLSFPEKSNEEVLAVARGSLNNMGRSIVEYAHFPFFSRKRIDDFFVFEGLENLDAALAKKKGVLLLGLHLGNGDFAIAASSLLGYKMNLISKRFKSKWLDELWFGMRGKHGTKFISPEKSSFDILRALNKNELVIFVLDQFMGPPIGVRTQFFGRQTGTAMGLAVVHLRTNAPLVFTYTYRRPDNKMVVVFETPLSVSDFGLDPNTEDRTRTISMLTQKYTDKIERTIRSHPEQWMWIHRRWKDFVDHPKS